MNKLDDKARSCLRLVQRSVVAAGGGWAPVNSKVWPHINKLVEDCGLSDLVEFKKNDHGQYCRLTQNGQTVVNWL